jgi:hypothetical protein
MGGKQHKKKRRPSGDELREKLARLHARGAWGEYLAVAHRALATPAGSGQAPHYLDVVDRAVTAALASGDIGEVVGLARALAQRAAGRPLVSLAGAVAALAGGRKELSRTALAALAAAPMAVGNAAPAGVVANLSALAGVDPAAATASLSPAVLELRALERALGGEGSALRPRSRSRPAFPTPFARAVAALAAVLAELAQASFAAEPRHVTALRKAAAALRDVPDAAARSAVDAVAEVVDVLADLAAGLAALRRRPRASLLGALLEWLVQDHLDRERLERHLAGDAGEGLLQYIRLAARMTWWSMLELATAGDAGAVAKLLDNHPALVAPYVVAAGDAPEGWLAFQQQRYEAMSALNSERYLELAELLTELSRGERDGGRLATLWALELDARRRGTIAELDDDEGDSDELQAVLEDAGFPRDRDEQAAARLYCRSLDRLAAIAGQLGRSVPAGQRTAVARGLRGYLLAVIDETDVGVLTGKAAAALLEHLPDDPALLLAAEAGFVCGGSRREAETVARRIGARGPAALIDPEAVAVIMRAVGDESPETLAGILAAARPLFPAQSWAAAVLPVAGAIATATAGFLSGHRDDSRVMRALAVGLELLAPHLEGTEPFDAARAVAELAANLDRGRSRIEAYRRRFPSLAAALQLLEVAFFACSRGSKAERRVVEDLAASAVERLGPNWETWLDSLPILVAVSEGTPAAVTLHQRLRALQRLPDLPGHARELLAAAIEATEVEVREERSRERAGKPGRGPGGRHERRRGARSTGTQLKLDL